MKINLCSLTYLLILTICGFHDCPTNFYFGLAMEEMVTVNSRNPHWGCFQLFIHCRSLKYMLPIIFSNYVSLTLRPCIFMVIKNEEWSNHHPRNWVTANRSSSRIKYQKGISGEWPQNLLQENFVWDPYVRRNRIAWHGMPDIKHFVNINQTFQSLFILFILS